MRQSDGRFALTPQVLELGHAYLSSLSLPDLAAPHLAALVETVHESSSVSILDGGDIVYVARVQARRIMSVAISLGTRFPAHQTSMGRVLLAGLPDEERARRLAAATLDARTPRTIVERGMLEAELRRVAEQGFALVDQELELGLRSIAAPIRRADGTLAGAVNLSVSAATLTPAQMRQRLLGPLRRTAERITADLGLAS